MSLLALLYWVRLDSKFDDPDMEERKLYVLYWQTKLSSNKEIDFPDHLVDEVAQLTDRFSFAYLKEVLYVASHHETSIGSHVISFQCLVFDYFCQYRKQ